MKPLCNTCFLSYTERILFKNFINQPQVALIPWILIYFAISSAFNWHISLGTTQPKCHLSFKYEGSLSYTSGNFASCSQNACQWLLLCRKISFFSSLRRNFHSLQTFWPWHISLFILLLIKFSVSHIKQMITVTLFHSFPATVFAHIIYLGVLEGGQGRKEVSMKLSAHVLLSITVQNNISLLYAQYKQCAYKTMDWTP
jgi:hypothetical protein